MIHLVMVCLNYQYTDRHARIEQLVAEILEKKQHPCFPQIVGAKKALHLFSEHTGAELQDIQTTTESSFPEPLYIFDDDLGGYTHQGILETLDDLQKSGKPINWD